MADDRANDGAAMGTLLSLALGIPVTAGNGALSTLAQSCPTTAGGLSAGAIAGIVIACLVFVGGCCCCVFFIIGYRRRYHKQTNKQLIHLWSIYLITLLVILSLYIMAIAHLSTYPSINLPNHNS